MPSPDNPRALAALGPCARCGSPTTQVASWRRTAKAKNGGTGHLEVVPLCDLHARRAIVSEDPPYAMDPVRRPSRPKPKADPPPEMFPGVGRVADRNR